MKQRFEPFERIIVKNKEKSSVWSCDMVSLATDYALYTFCRGEIDFRYYDVLPFAENEHLVGTSETPEKVELKYGDAIICFNDFEDIDVFNFVLSKYKGLMPNNILSANEEGWAYCIPFSQFNPNDIKETRKHIHFVRNGKLVKVKA